MSGRRGPGGPAGFEQYFTVFAGSSVEDVSYAKLFWSSASLNPPLESRLVSGDTRQRLRTAGGPQAQASAVHGLQTTDTRCEEFLHEAYLQQKAEEKQRYLEKAKKREELLALLQKQRADRIRKEKISQPYRPKNSMEAQSPLRPGDQLEEALAQVRALH
nr:PREDICTED: UPF0722 protein C11orf88 homolog isoform X1 [Lepisosteus oculatus]